MKYYITEDSYLQRSEFRRNIMQHNTSKTFKHYTAARYYNN